MWFPTGSEIQFVSSQQKNSPAKHPIHKRMHEAIVEAEERDERGYYHSSYAIYLPRWVLI